MRSKHSPSKRLHIASLACVVHCILAPVIVIFAPFTAQIVDNVWVEFTILIASILFGIFIIYNGYCAHKRVHSMILFGIGVLLWTLHTCFEDHRLFGSILYVLIGTAFVCGSYYVNHRHINCCQTDTCDRK